MLHTRRQFVRAGFSLGAVLALHRASRAAAPAAGHPATPGSPGLLFDAADLPRIRATVQRPEFQTFWGFMTAVDFAAEEKFLREVRVTNHVTHMARAEIIMMRSAFVHVVTPDPRHLAHARTALHKLLEYPRWDWLQNSRQEPVTIMRGALACLAFALVADWLAADLTAEEQAAITHGIGTAGGPACYRGLYDLTHHETAGPWSLNPGEEDLPPVDVARWPTILNETNLRIICTAGLAAAACHLHGRHPEAPQWLALTEDSLKLYASWQPKDGSFSEGVGYWDFTFTHYIFAVEILRRKLGLDERALVNFPAQTRFALEMTMPTAGHPNDCINIGDVFIAATGVPLSWIARNFREAGAQYLVLQPKALTPAWTTALAAIWFDPTVTARLPADASLDRRQALGIVISRTGWDEPDTVVTLRSGGPVNHEHADRNSVIFKAHGERLLNDPIHAAYSTAEPRWLLRQTEAHTAVLIDGHGHIYHDGHDGTNASVAQAVIQDYRVGLDWMAVTSDAADAYRRAGLPVRLVQRTLVFLKPEVLVIFDRVVLAEPRPVQARYQVFNEDGAGRVTSDGLAFGIDRPFASLRAHVTGASDGRLVTGKLQLPEASGTYPFAEYRSASAKEHAFLTLCTAAPRMEPHGQIDVRREAAAWHVSGTHRGKAIRLTITTGEDHRAPLIQL